MIAMLTVESLGGGAHIRARLQGERALVKQYRSFKTAASEAEDLGAILPFNKDQLDASLPGPNYPKGFQAKVNVEVADLIERGFRSDGGKP